MVGRLSRHCVSGAWQVSQLGWATKWWPLLCSGKQPAQPVASPVIQVFTREWLSAASDVQFVFFSRKSGNIRGWTKALQANIQEQQGLSLRDQEGLVKLTKWGGNRREYVCQWWFSFFLFFCFVFAFVFVFFLPPPAKGLMCRFLNKGVSVYSWQWQLQPLTLVQNGRESNRKEKQVDNLSSGSTKHNTSLSPNPADPGSDWRLSQNKGKLVLKKKKSSESQLSRWFFPGLHERGVGQGGGGREGCWDNTTATRIQMTEKWQRWVKKADLSPQNFTKGNCTMWWWSGLGCRLLPTCSCCLSQPCLGALAKAGEERG